MQFLQPQAIVVGAFFGVLLTKSKLAELSGNYQSKTNAKDIGLPIAGFGLVSLVSYFLSVLFEFSLLHSMSTSVYACGVSLLVARASMFVYFEWKQKMRIMQRWTGLGMVLIPKAPEENR